MHRIVLHYTSGERAGLYQILGTTDQLIEHLNVNELPARVETVDFYDHHAPAIRVGTHTRYVLYREWRDVHSQQLNDLHPEQI
jgi:hypothetical protein